MENNTRNLILGHINLRKKSNPVYSVELEKSYGVTGAEIRIIVQEARRKGIPIANDNGYYLAATYEEFQPTIKDLESRALSMLNTIRLFKIRFGLETADQKSLF